MRIVVWNCAQALHAKYERLTALRPDIAIVPECAEPDVVRRKAPQFAFSDCEWTGDMPQKGLGVFSFGTASLRRHQSWARRYQNFIPVEVRGSSTFNLLAVWAFNRRARACPNPPTTQDAVAYYRPFLMSGDSVVAGDFNANAIWDNDGRYAKFTELDRELRSLGLESAYHAKTGAVLGQEQDGTLFWQKKATQPYHIDYVYLRERWARAATVAIGTATDWLPYSDHAPVIVDMTGPQ